MTNIRSARFVLIRIKSYLFSCCELKTRLLGSSTGLRTPLLSCKIFLSPCWAIGALRSSEESSIHLGIHSWNLSNFEIKAPTVEHFRSAKSENCPIVSTSYIVAGKRKVRYIYRHLYSHRTLLWSNFVYLYIL